MDYSSNYWGNNRFADFNKKKALLDKLSESNLINNEAYSSFLMLLMGQWLDESAKEKVIDKYHRVIARYGEK